MKGRRALIGLSACAAASACSVYDDTLLSLRGVITGGAASDVLGGAGTTGGGGSAGNANFGGAGTPSVGGVSEKGGSAGAAGEGRGGTAADGGRSGEGGTLASGGAGTSSEAGAGGATDTPPNCETTLLPPKGSWSAQASHSSLGQGEEFYNPPEYLMDLSPKRWSTGKVQQGDEWLQIDFGAPAAVRELTFTLRPDDAEDYPRLYQVVISDTPLNRDGLVIASGSGALGQTLTVTLPELAVGRYLFVMQKGADPLAWWSVAELTARCY